MEIPSYYAIIPANVRYDKSLKANEKLLYGEITCLTQKTGKCFASNQYFSELYGVDKTTISRWISNLKKQGYIEIEMEYNGKQIINRYIQLNQYPIDEKINTPIDEKVKDNNTSLNITSINNKEKIYKKEIISFQEKRKKNEDKFMKEVQEIFSETGTEIEPYRKEIQNFILYWTEANGKGKERWEFQKTFEIKRRFRTWMSNKIEWKSDKTNRKEMLSI